MKNFCQLGILLSLLVTCYLSFAYLTLSVVLAETDPGLVTGQFKTQADVLIRFYVGRDVLYPLMELFHAPPAWVYELERLPNNIFRLNRKLPQVVPYISHVEIHLITWLFYLERICVDAAINLSPSQLRELDYLLGCL